MILYQKEVGNFIEGFTSLDAQNTPLSSALRFMAVRQLEISQNIIFKKLTKTYPWG